MLFKIAWRNIWRSRTRSLVVIASVAVGLFAGMFIISFSKGMIDQEIRSAIETQLSDIQIHHPAFPDDKLASDTIPGSSALLQSLATDPHIRAISPRVIATGMISSPATAAGVEIHGIDPAAESKVSSISGEIVQGSYFSGKPDELVIGEQLVRKLGVKLHSKIVLTLQSVTGDLTAGSFRIAGIFRSRNSAFDQTTVFTRSNDLGQLLGTGPAVHEIAIVLNDDRQVDSVARQIQTMNPHLLVQTWSALSPEIALLNGIFDQLLYIIIGIILLALLFGIINTMLMAVLERQREFGMLMAIGMNKLRLFLMILMESILLTCAGLPAGILLTIGAVEWLGRQGIDMSAFSQALMQYGFSNKVYPVLEASMFLPVTLMTALTAVLSALYPAYKALSYKPAEAIRKI